MPEPGRSGTGRYRADFYVFRHFLMGMGTFRDDGVRSHTSMKLIFGVNRPFRIRLADQWLDARAALVAGGTPHFINGDGDWQIILWIEADSSLGILLEARTLEGRRFAVQGGEDKLAIDEVIQTAGDLPDPAGALELAEILLYAYGGVRPVGASWDNEIRDIVTLIEADPGKQTVRSLADEAGCSVPELEADFRRVMGAALDDYLHRRKISTYVGYRQEGMKKDEALRRSGLPGWVGVSESFRARYGLDLEILEKQSPFVRVYRGREDQAVLYL